VTQADPRKRKSEGIESCIAMMNILPPNHFIFKPPTHGLPFRPGSPKAFWAQSWLLCSAASSHWIPLLEGPPLFVFIPRQRWKLLCLTSLQAEKSPVIPKTHAATSLDTGMEEVLSKNLGFQRPGMVMPIYNPRTLEAEAGESQVCG
jgi:hypothetical protein